MNGKYGPKSPEQRRQENWFDEPVSRRDALTYGAGAVLIAMGIVGWVESERSRPAEQPSELPGSLDELPEDTPDAEYESGDDKDAEFVAKYGEFAQAVEDEYGVPYHVTLAMGILESGHGGSELATEAHNFHGLKANNEWFGDVHKVVTKEHVLEEDISNYDVVDEPVLLDNGYYEISIEASFKKFSSARKGFNGFGDHLANRFGGEAYADAFKYTDPYEFAKALFDGEGAKWATDTRYVEKVLAVLDRLTGENREALHDGIEMPEWGSSELGDFQRRQFGNQQEYEQVVDQIRRVETSRQGYEAFLGNMIDVSGDVMDIPGAKAMFPDKENNYRLVDAPRITLHYTAWAESAWGHDWKKFMSSVINNREATGKTASANYYLDRNGKTAILTGDGQAAYHAGRRVDGYPFYNAETTGVEMPAGKQSDITPEMYEATVYLVVYQYRRDNPGKKPSQSDMRKYTVGHGEIAEFSNGKVSDHKDFPRAVADAVADLSWQLLQEV